VRYHRKKVHVRYLISWWVLVLSSYSLLPYCWCSGNQRDPNDL